MICYHRVSFGAASLTNAENKSLHKLAKHHPGLKKEAHHREINVLHKA